MKGLVTRNTHIQYERSITSGLEVIAKVKVFVHATEADADADGRAMTLAPRTYLSRLPKKGILLRSISTSTCNLNSELYENFIYVNLAILSLTCTKVSFRFKNLQNPILTEIS